MELREIIQLFLLTLQPVVVEVVDIHFPAAMVGQAVVAAVQVKPVEHVF
jgi:hypothetical protein